MIRHSPVELIVDRGALFVSGEGERKPGKNKLKDKQASRDERGGRIIAEKGKGEV